MMPRNVVVNIATRAREVITSAAQMDFCSRIVIAVTSKEFIGDVASLALHFGVSLFVFVASFPACTGIANYFDHRKYSRVMSGHVRSHVASTSG